MINEEKEKRTEREKKLRRYLIAIDKLRRKRYDAARWESMSMGPTGGIGSRSGKAQPDTIKETAIQLRQECEDLAVKARDFRQELSNALSLMEDDQLRELLESKYIDGLSNKDLQEKTPYCDRHMRRLLTRAIRELDKCSSFFS